jgi:hypothetical protein
MAVMSSPEPIPVEVMAAEPAAAELDEAAVVAGVVLLEMLELMNAYLFR